MSEYSFPTYLKMPKPASRVAGIVSPNAIWELIKFYNDSISTGSGSTEDLNLSAYTKRTVSETVTGNWTFRHSAGFFVSSNLGGDVNQYVDTVGNLIINVPTNYGVHTNGDVVAFSALSPVASSWWDDLPIATASVLGGIKVGTNLSITAGGVLSATGGGVSDHGALTGLADDDHAGYLLTTGARAISGLTASELIATDGSKVMQSLAVAVYPSLAEIAHVKNVTSAIQTQLNAKEATISASNRVNATEVGTGVVDNTEFNYLNGVTSAIQTQFSGKEDTISASNRVNATEVGVGSITNTEFGFLNGVTSAIQGQLDNKEDTIPANTYELYDTAIVKSDENETITKKWIFKPEGVTGWAVTAQDFTTGSYQSGFYYLNDHFQLYGRNSTGANRFLFNTNGDSYFMQQLAIGQTTANYSLDVVGEIRSQDYTAETTGGSYRVVIAGSTDGSIQIRNNSAATKLFLRSNGNSYNLNYFGFGDSASAPYRAIHSRGAVSGLYVGALLENAQGSGSTQTSVSLDFNHNGTGSAGTNASTGRIMVAEYDVADYRTNMRFYVQNTNSTNTAMLEGMRLLNDGTLHCNGDVIAYSTTI